MSGYARWRDDDGVVHWVEARVNRRVYTSCHTLVEQLPHVDAPTGYVATRHHPTCVRCVCDAIDDIYASTFA